MQLGLSDKYMVYRLVKQSDPYKPYIKGHGNWPGKEVRGICNLEFLFEAESVLEVFEQKPIVELFYMCDDKNVKPFVMDEEYTFRGLGVSSERGSVNYHTDGTSPIEGEQAFEYIYKTYDNDVVVVIDAWNMAHVGNVHLVLENIAKKQYHLWYDVEIKSG